jgi:hypothetical protein
MCHHNVWIVWPLNIYKSWYFWYENIPSGTPGESFIWILNSELKSANLIYFINCKFRTRKDFGIDQSVYRTLPGNRRPGFSSRQGAIFFIGFVTLQWCYLELHFTLLACGNLSKISAQKYFWKVLNSFKHCCQEKGLLCGFQALVNSILHPLALWTIAGVHLDRFISIAYPLRSVFYCGQCLYFSFQHTNNAY